MGRKVSLENKAKRISQKTITMKKINIIVSVIFVIIIGLSVALQTGMNRKNALMACDVAMDQAEDVKKSLAAGMNAHLAKPLKIESVIAIIAKYFRESGSDR